MTTPNLTLAELSANQAQPHVTLNSSLRRLDAVGAPGSPVISITNTPPGSPSDGDCYIVSATATGDWAGHEDDIAAYIGTGWEFFTPEVGWIVSVQALATQYAYGFGSPLAWEEVASGATGAAEDITYDNSTSGMTATDVQGAIDELEAAVSSGFTNDGAAVKRTTNITTVGSTWTLFAFDTEDRDDGNYWSSGASSRFTITNPGYYIVSLFAFFGAASQSVGVAIGLNGSPTTATNEVAAGPFGASAANQRAMVTTVLYLNASDYVEAYCYTSANGSVAAGTNPARFVIHRLG
jgi:hypothetical protein